MIKITCVIKKIFSSVAKTLLIMFMITLYAVTAYLLMLIVDWRIIAATSLFVPAMLIFLIGWYLPDGKAQKWFTRISAAVTVIALFGTIVMTGISIYENAVTIHERDLSDGFGLYRPFDDNSLIARTDKEMPARFSLADAPRLQAKHEYYPLVSEFVNAIYPESEINDYGACDYLKANDNPCLINEDKSDVFIGPEEVTENELFDESLAESTVIAKDAVVLYTHESNPVKTVSTDQLKKILTGKITNWKDVGGRDMKIKLYTGEHGLANYLLKEYLDCSTIDGEIGIRTLIILHYGFQTYCLPYRNVKGALGFALKSEIDKNYENTHLIAIDGAFPDNANIAAETYPLSYDILAITRKNRSENEKRLIDFILSDVGSELTEKSGLVPLTD